MASSSVKRQRKRKRIDTDGDPEFQVAPMVDVLLVLMLFFMAITSTEVLQKNKNVTLAEADHGKDPSKDNKNKVTINVVWDAINSVANFDVDGVTPPPGSDIMQGLQSIVASRTKNNPKAFVLIRADKDVQYSNIADLMNACANAGIGTVTFAVLTGGAKTKAPAAGSGAAPSN